MCHRLLGSTKDTRGSREGWLAGRGGAGCLLLASVAPSCRWLGAVVGLSEHACEKPLGSLEICGACKIRKIRPSTPSATTRRWSGLYPSSFGQNSDNVLPVGSGILWAAHPCARRESWHPSMGTAVRFLLHTSIYRFVLYHEQDGKFSSQNSCICLRVGAAIEMMGLGDWSNWWQGRFAPGKGVDKPRAARPGTRRGSLPAEKRLSFHVLLLSIVWPRGTWRNILRVRVVKTDYHVFCILL